MSEPFKPCIVAYEEGGYTEFMLEDVPGVTELQGRPVVELIRALEDRSRIIGFRMHALPVERPPLRVPMQMRPTDRAPANEAGGQQAQGEGEQ
jgi:hypothetical protein